MDSKVVTPVEDASATKPPSGPESYLYWKNMPLEEKRRHYTCGSDYVTLDKIPTWQKDSGSNSPLATKISLWKGNIVSLEIDAIVNAAKNSLLGGGGVDGAIHEAAGESLLDECRPLKRCDDGDAKLTHGHRLPAKYILHTVGPGGKGKESENTLASCYKTCLKLVEENELRSVAFCCVATGIFGFPKEDAAKIVLPTVREWLKVNADKVERIIFCMYSDEEYKIYHKLIPQYFPSEKEKAIEGEDKKDCGGELLPLIGQLSILRAD